jgi:hypothetical protein
VSFDRERDQHLLARLTSPEMRWPGFNRPRVANVGTARASSRAVISPRRSTSVENRSLSEVRRALTPDGTLVLNSGTGASGLRLLVRLVRPMIVGPFVRHQWAPRRSAPGRPPEAMIGAWTTRRCGS